MEHFVGKRRPLTKHLFTITVHSLIIPVTRRYDFSPLTIQYTVNVPLDKTARNETSSRNKSPKTSQQYKIMVDESRTILLNSTRMNWTIFFDILGLILKMMCQACARGIDVQ